MVPTLLVLGVHGVTCCGTSLQSRSGSMHTLSPSTVLRSSPEYSEYGVVYSEYSEHSGVLRSTEYSGALGLRSEYGVISR
jgi:hypothetical protein